jgi:hypothetical protein
LFETIQEEFYQAFLRNVNKDKSCFNKAEVYTDPVRVAELLA